MINLNSNNVDYNIMLASSSPRRHELLAQLGISFKPIAPPAIEENVSSNIYREDIALSLAKQKADVYKDLEEKDLIITADTIVWIDDKVLGKPRDYSDAFQMLRLLSGKSHYVITGVCLKAKHKQVVFHAETLVRFANLSDEEIKHYIEVYKPYDKAGAYGIQEWIGKIGIDYIEGSFYNVVGLPVQMLYQELKKF